MFSIKEEEQNGFTRFVLEDDVHGTRAAVLPACGAILHEFSVRKNGERLNLVDSYSNRKEFKEELEAKGFKGSKLSPFVCRLKNGSYKFGEAEHTIQKFYLGKHALHGLLYDAPFKVMSSYADKDAANLQLSYAYEGADEGYPFKYDCIVNYRLQPNNQLTITSTIVNRDEGIIPIADGWHPYFGFGGSINDCQLEFQSKEQVVFDSELLPTGDLVPYQEFGSLEKIGEQNFDDCFTLNFAECQPMVVLRDPQQHLQIEIHPDPSYPYLQVYTPPHRQSIALENLSTAPDAFNNNMGLISLASGAEASFVTRYRIVHL